MRDAAKLLATRSDQKFLGEWDWRRKRWKLPGGRKKKKRGETDLQCLLREIKEEFLNLQLHNVSVFLEIITASAKKRGKKKPKDRAVIFTAKVSGSIEPRWPRFRFAWVPIHGSPQTTTTRKTITTAIERGYFKR